MTIPLPHPAEDIPPVPAPARRTPGPARRPRSASERLRKPVTWLALAALVPVWTGSPGVANPGARVFLEGIGLLAVVVAMLGRVWCAVYIAGRKNAELCQDGPYSLVRNPLYVFSFIGALGVALASHRWPLVALVIPLFLAYYHLVVKSEESRLATLFPQSYPAYCNEVPRGWPRFHGFRTRTLITLDPRDVARAMLEVVWFPLAFVAVAALARLS